MRWAMLVAIVVAGCGPELPAICDMPGDRPVVTHGQHIEVCDSCDDDGCTALCASYCDEGGNIEGYLAGPEIDGVPRCGAFDELFCGRWVDD